MGSNKYHVTNQKGLSADEEEIMKLQEISENDIILENGENQPEEKDDRHPTNEVVEVTSVNEPEARKKRGLPKTMLVNQLKYLEILERQQKMSNSSKKKKPQDTKTIMKPSPPVSQEGMRRVIVAGKVKYLPMKPMETPPKTDEQKNPDNHVQKVFDVEPSKIMEIKSVSPLLLEKLMEESKPTTGKIVRAKENADNSKNGSAGKKIPRKYAIQIENDIKKQTVKNVRNFSDLRRIKAMQDIAPDTEIDVSKASIAELRKLRIEQRKKELAELKKKAEANKKETAIQDILKNDKLSKFAKTIAIKNLSINSRNRRVKNVSQ